MVPVRLDQQLSDHSTVDEIASGAADCRLAYTMANCPQRRKRRGESQSFLFGDADQESETRMNKNALRTGRRQAVDLDAEIVGGGDRGRVAIYRPSSGNFAELKSYCQGSVWCSLGQRQAYSKAHATMNFVGPDLRQTEHISLQRFEKERLFRARLSTKLTTGVMSVYNSAGLSSFPAPDAEYLQVLGTGGIQGKSG
ncbi:hypothetical protein TNCV_4115681 [Trichonephila clavipes]|nr:hypothetical protein TNCV_4115681 [Trichonephila clavipes]